MLKKFFIFAFAFLLILNISKSFAFLDKVKNSNWLTDVLYQNLYVISENDFQDMVEVQISGAPANTLFDVQVDWDGDGQPFLNLISTTTNSDGEINLTVPHTWARWTPYSTDNGEYKVDFKAIPASEDHNDPSKFIGPAKYKAEVHYINTNISNNAGITENQKVKKGTAVTFTCSNSSEIYYGTQANWPTSATLVSSKYSSANNKSSDYTIGYNTTLNTAGKYRVECSNIGYEASPSTITDFDFEVVDGFDILSINSSPNNIGSGQTLTWTSEANDYCQVYDSSKITKLADGSKTTGNNWKAVVATTSTRTTPGNTIYYIKCRAVDNYPVDTLEKDGSDSRVGYKAYTANITCPSGTTWDAPTNKCKTTSDPTGTLTATPNPCTIALNANSCDTKLTWTTTNPGGTSQVTSNYPSAGTVIANSNNGNATVTIPYNSRQFFLYNSSLELANVSVNANCAAGSTWDGSKCATTTCPSGQLKDSLGNCRNTFDILNVASTPNKPATDNTFTWSTLADVCNIYANDKATKLNTANPTKAGNNWTGIIPASNMGSGTGSRLYYIKCASTNNPKRLPDTTLEKDVSDEFTGFRAYTVTIAGCPSGQVADGTGYCHVACPSGQTWNETTKVCENNPTTSGTLSATSCEINDGASTCNSDLN